MQLFFKNVFQYNYQLNQRIIKQLIKVENDLPKEIMALLSHSINAHQIWNARINNSKPLGVNEKHNLEKCTSLNTENYENTIGILNTDVFERRVCYQNSKGKIYKNTVQEILFHVVNHYSHHRGQLIIQLKKAGLKPIVTDYIFYKR